MFGESIAAPVKSAVETAIDQAGRVLVVGSSLATYSAWRLVKKAKEQGKPIGVLNLGGVRGEEAFFANVPSSNDGHLGVRCNESANKVLPMLVESLRGMYGATAQDTGHVGEVFQDAGVYESTPLRTPS